MSWFAREASFWFITTQPTYLAALPQSCPMKKLLAASGRPPHMDQSSRSQALAASQPSPALPLSKAAPGVMGPVHTPGLTYVV